MVQDFLLNPCAFVGCNSQRVGTWCFPYPPKDLQNAIYYCCEAHATENVVEVQVMLEDEEQKEGVKRVRKQTDSEFCLRECEEEDDEYEESEKKPKKKEPRIRKCTTAHVMTYLGSRGFSDKKVKTVMRTFKQMGDKKVPFKIPFPAADESYYIVVPVECKDYEALLAAGVSQKCITPECYLKWRLVLIKCADEKAQDTRLDAIIERFIHFGFPNSFGYLARF